MTDIANNDQREERVDPLDLRDMTYCGMMRTQTGTMRVSITLFLFTGSVVQPLRAPVLNLIGLGAALGVMTGIFDDGKPLGLTSLDRSV